MKKEQAKKVPDYTARAIDKYHAKFDRCMAALPKGYKQIIADKIGMSANAYLNMLVREDLKKRGLIPGDETTENTAATDDSALNFDFSSDAPFK